MTRAELLPRIFALSSGDQVMIAEAIRNHLVGGLAPVDEEEFKRELAKNVADTRAHPEDGVTLDELMARLKKKRA